MLGFAASLLGASLMLWGGLTAARGSRPGDLVGAVAAPLGLALLAAGVVELFRPGFLG